MKRIFNSMPFKTFIISRMGLLLIIALSFQVQFSSVPAREGLNFHLSTPSSKEEAVRKLSFILHSADSHWYLELAKNGYHEGHFDIQTPRNWVFFPLFPMTVKALSVFFKSPFVAALLLSNFCFLLSLFVFEKICLHLKLSHSAKTIALWLLAFHPTSYFFSAPLTESLFLLLTLTTWLMLFEKKFLSASASMALALVTRPTGALLLPAYGLRLLMESEKKPSALLKGIVLLPWGVLAFLTFLYIHTGHPFAFALNQPQWSREGAASIQALTSSLFLQAKYPFGPWNFNYLHLASVFVASIAFFASLKGKRYDFSLLLSIPILFALSTATLMSLTRFVMVLFPLYISLGEWADESEAKKNLLLVTFSILFGIMVCLYANHVTVAMA